MIKHAIKDPQAPNNSKFNALYLLKELMKSKPKKLVDYVEKKLAPRLEALAISDKGDQCLLEFAKNSDKNWSANFHYLNRECFNNWGEMFRATNPSFAKAADRLRSMRRLPVDNKFYDRVEPGQVQPPAPGNFIPESPLTTGSSIANRVIKAQQLRQELKRYLASGQFRNMDDQAFLNSYSGYVQEVRELAKDPQIKSLLTNTNPKMEPADKKLGEEIGREEVFVEQLSQSYDESKRKNDGAGFLDNFQNIYNIFFENDMVDLGPSIKALQGANKPGIQSVPEHSFDQIQAGNKDVGMRQPYDVYVGAGQTQGDYPSTQTRPLQERDDNRQRLPDNDRIPHSNDQGLGIYDSHKEYPPQSKYKEQNKKDDSYEFNLPQDLKIHKKNEYEFDDFSHENIRSDFPQLIDKTANKNKEDFGSNQRPNLAESDRFGNNFDSQTQQKYKIDQLFNENEELKRDIEELENRKKNLESKVKGYQDPIVDKQRSRLLGQSTFQTPHNDGAGFFRVLKNKDEQIDKLSTKIQRLEKEYQRISLREDSPDQILNSRRRVLDDISMDGSQSIETLGLGKYESARKAMKKRAERQQEMTGSVFVDQMYRDINRLLNKPNRSNTSTRDIIY